MIFTKKQYTTDQIKKQPKQHHYINNWELPTGEILAPMAGISDSPYRRVVRRFGAGLLYTEVIAAEGVRRRSRVSLDMLTFHPEERPIAAQLFGSMPEQFEDAAAMVREVAAPDMIDINCGCPVKKFVTRGGGGWLMQDPDLIGRIVEAAKRGSGLPVSVKLRIGYIRPDVTVIRAAQAAVSAGAVLVAVHGRWVRGAKGTDAEWDIIGEVKTAVNVPVVGNGDIASYADVRRMVAVTGCDRVMIGRWAAGRPWLFGGLSGVTQPDGELIPPPMKERISILLGHYQLMDERFGDGNAMLRMRKHLGWYTRGMPDGAALRFKVNTTTDTQQILDLLMQFQATLPDDDPIEQSEPGELLPIPCLD